MLAALLLAPLTEKAQVQVAVVTALAAVQVEAQMVVQVEQPMVMVLNQVHQVVMSLTSMPLAESRMTRMADMVVVLLNYMRVLST